MAHIADNPFKNSKGLERLKRAALIGPVAALSLSLMGCDRPISAEYRVGASLEGASSDAAFVIASLLAQPESGKYSESDKLSSLAAIDRTRIGSYPALTAEKIEAAGQSWLKIHAETPNPQAPEHIDSIMLLYKTDPLLDPHSEPLKPSAVQNAAASGELTAATVTQIGTTYGAFFEGDRAHASMSTDPTQPDPVTKVLRGEQIDTGEDSNKEQPDYEILNTMKIILRKTTDDLMAAAN